MDSEKHTAPFFPELMTSGAVCPGNVTNTLTMKMTMLVAGEDTEERHSSGL